MHDTRSRASLHFTAPWPHRCSVLVRIRINVSFDKLPGKCRELATWRITLGITRIRRAMAPSPSTNPLFGCFLNFADLILARFVTCQVTAMMKTCCIFLHIKHLFYIFSFFLCPMLNVAGPWKENCEEAIRFSYWC